MDTYLCTQPQWFEPRNAVPAKVSNKYLQRFSENPGLSEHHQCQQSICTFADTQLHGLHENTREKNQGLSVVTQLTNFTRADLESYRMTNIQYTGV